MAQPAAPAVPDTSDSSSSLKVAGIPQLSAPDSSSNYLDWSFVVTVHLSSLNLAYLLKPVKLEDRPARWAKDNADVCSFIARTVHQDNLRLIRSFPTNATAMWESLQSAHIDSTAGGRIYWLRKLVTIRMSTDDVETHIKEMALCAERLNSLVTPDKPLTVDDIHAAALLGSLPVDWLHCVSSLMNEDSVTSSRIVAALKAEALRRKSRGEEDLSISASKARATSTSKGRPPFDDNLLCSFCRIKGHDLAVCENAARILSEHQHPKGQGGESKRQSGSQKDPSKNEGSRRSSSGRGQQSSQAPAKAGLTTVVELGSDSDDESDHSGSAYAGNVTASDVSGLVFSAVASSNANIDSGCSMNMTPHLDQVSRPRISSVPVRLADSSVVHATHKGTSTLPIDIMKSVKTLVVPSLHEPLLSVASLCDSSLRLVFTPTSCDIYDEADFKVVGSVVGRGYRKGNLYYLPSAEVSNLSKLSSV